MSCSNILVTSRTKYTRNVLRLYAGAQEIERRLGFRGLFLTNNHADLPAVAATMRALDAADISKPLLRDLSLERLARL